MSATENTVAFNAAKNGIEIRFHNKPNEQVRQAVKSAGFRFSPKGPLWWAKYTPELWQWAHSFIAWVKQVESQAGAQPIEIVHAENVSGVVAITNQPQTQTVLAGTPA